MRSYSVNDFEIQRILNIVIEWHRTALHFSKQHNRMTICRRRPLAKSDRCAGSIHCTRENDTGDSDLSWRIVRCTGSLHRPFPVFPRHGAALPLRSCAADAPGRLLVVMVFRSGPVALIRRCAIPPGQGWAPTFVTKCPTRPVSPRLLSRGYVLVSGPSDQSGASQSGQGSVIAWLSDRLSRLFHAPTIRSAGRSVKGLTGVGNPGEAGA